MEVDVQDVVDKARDWDAVVTDIKVVHEHEVHAGKLSNERPARGVAEGDGGAGSRSVLSEGCIFVAHVLLPISRARR